MPAVQEATHLCQIVPFERNYIKDPDNGWELWEINTEFTEEEEIEASLRYLFYLYSGKSYGYGQLLYFIYRWAFEGVGLKAPKNNPLGSGLICSELVYYYLDLVGLDSRVKHLSHDTVNAEDLYRVVTAPANRGLFRLVASSESSARSLTE